MFIERETAQEECTYDQLNRLTQKLYPDSTTVNYTYDNDSRLTQVTDPTGTYSFTFDNMGRLTNTTTSYAFLTGRNFTTSFAYDAASNRTGFTDPEGGSSAYAYDTLNRLPIPADFTYCRASQLKWSKKGTQTGRSPNPTGCPFSSNFREKLVPCL